SLIGELLCRQLAQAADHAVAERAGGERRIGLDQRHGDARIGLPERAGTARATEAAPDHDDARRGALPEGAIRSQRGGSGGRDAELQEFSTLDHQRCAAYQAAIAWISSSVNPLAILSMTVPARVPERKSCMALTIAAPSRPASRGTGEVTRVDAG